MAKFTTISKYLGIWIFITSMVVLPGCADLQGAIAQTSAWRDEAKGVRVDLRSQLDILKQQRGSLPDGSSDALLVDSSIMRAKGKLQLLEAAIVRADLVIQEATNPTNSLTQAANTISPWIPAPAQGPLVLGAALLATFVRSRNLKQSATSIIQSIEHTLCRDPEFKQLFTQHADTIRTIQTPGARRLIDSTIKKSAHRAARL